MIDHGHTTEYGLHSAITHGGRRCPAPVLSRDVNLLSQHQDWWVLGERRYYRPARISHVFSPPKLPARGLLAIKLIVIPIGAPTWLIQLCSKICQLRNLITPYRMLMSRLLVGLDTKQRSSAQSAVQVSLAVHLANPGMRFNVIRKCQETAVSARPR
jgi:hypothetical protein